ncbi:MAG: hypothetical protein Ct9H300mP18_11150 [Candidatus Neomarinimicrobiota bacterium]|nr:MAG: hypothetical protein Ct9H300mP18_11150 [Candidatus Neomarinimicrobiota bacterium]
MGPAVIVTHVDRLQPHSSSDDHLKVSHQERNCADGKKTIPLKSFQMNAFQMV